jgi:nucleoside-diphosphate-sugar epimerase
MFVLALECRCLTPGIVQTSCPDILSGTVRRMRIFVTGATGYVGGAVARCAVRHGLHVTGLVRAEAGARVLERAGIEPLRGRLEDDAALRRGAGAADAVVHAAFARDGYEHLDAAVDVEVRATRSLLDATAGRDVPVVYTSGIGVVGGTDRPVQEDDEPATPGGMRWRRSLELQVLAADGVVVRPAFVYGHGGNELLRALIRAATASGVAAYPGDGGNRWPNVHVDDLAALYLAALGRGERGAVFHGVGGEATVRSVCGSIARLVGGVSASLPPNEARAVVPFADWIGGTSIHAGTARTRETLAWTPTGPTVHDDVEHGSYRPLLHEEAR